MTKRLTTKEFIDYCTKIHNGKYSYNKTVYVNKRSKVIINCPIHGDFEQIAHNHKRGQGCPICGQNYAREWRKYNYKKFINESKLRFNNEYEFPYIRNEYENSHSKITIRHKNCGREFIKIACDHITSPNGGCTHCYKKITSKIEEEIKTLLQDNNIKFYFQHRFDWLGLQSLDFYLPDYNIAIECQGRQHFESVEYFGGDEGLKQTKERDLLKEKLCNEHNIKLYYFSNKQYNNEIITNEQVLIEKILKL